MQSALQNTLEQRLRAPSPRGHSRDQRFRCSPVEWRLGGVWVAFRASAGVWVEGHLQLLSSRLFALHSLHIFQPAFSWRPLSLWCRTAEVSSPVPSVMGVLVLRLPSQLSEIPLNSNFTGKAVRKDRTTLIKLVFLPGSRTAPDEMESLKKTNSDLSPFCYQHFLLKHPDTYLHDENNLLCCRYPTAVGYKLLSNAWDAV